MLLALGGGTCFGHYWWTTGRYLVSTDDAYVGAKNATLSPKVSGYISDIAVADNARVARGRHDRRASTTATIASRCRPHATRSPCSRPPSSGSACQIGSAAGGRRSGQGAARFRPGRRDAGGPRAQAPAGPRRTPDQQQAVARAGASHLRPVRRRRAVGAGGDRVGRGKRRRAQGAAGRSAAYAAAIFRRRSPRPCATSPSPSSAHPSTASSAIAPMQVGDYVQPTQRLASLVPLDAIYIDANFKETQLAHVHPGQPVSIAIDAFPDRKLEGKVVSFAPASGSVFSLLPPDNATGNFTKIVQRLPVRILVPRGRCRAVSAAPGHVGGRQRQHQARRAGHRPEADEGHRAHQRQLSSSEEQAAMAATATAAATAPQHLSRGAGPGRGAHRAAPAVRLPRHGVRHVHGDPRRPDRFRLADRDPGRPRRLRQRDHLGADRLPDRRGGDDPAVGLPVARGRHAHPVRRLGGRLHGREPDVRPLHQHQRDDLLAGRPGFHRRRHDPDRVRHRLHHLPALEDQHRHAHDRPGGDAGAHHRPDRRRLSHRCALLALAVLHQHCPGPRGHRRRVRL